jgi:hypothetical protein
MFMLPCDVGCARWVGLPHARRVARAHGSRGIAARIGVEIPFARAPARDPPGRGSVHGSCVRCTERRGSRPGIFRHVL